MRAMQMTAPGAPLRPIELLDPEPMAGEARIRIGACAVCRTDLHVVDGDLAPLKSPLTPGHEIVGVIEKLGPGATGLMLGARVGVGWLGGTCAACDYCRGGRENLCDAPQFTGYSRDGGFATHAIVDARFAYPLSTDADDAELAPLMCAGLIGWRALKSAGDARVLGLYGFGAAAHIIVQVGKRQGRRVHAFTRPGDRVRQDFARSLGADWAGDADEAAPEILDAAIIFAPIGALAPVALRAVRKGGRVVCAGIHMSDIPSFPYQILWGERSLTSVANLTRADALEFLSLAGKVELKTHVTRYPLLRANEALTDLRNGAIQGAAVLIP